MTIDKKPAKLVKIQPKTSGDSLKKFKLLFVSTNILVFVFRPCNFFKIVFNPFDLKNHLLLSLMLAVANGSPNYIDIIVLVMII